MNYLKIKTTDIANGDGVRVSLFVSGCRMHCKWCFNPESWNFDAGYVFDDFALECILFELDKHYVDGLSILGGDPFEPENMQTVKRIVDIVRKEFPEKTIWMWTGRKYETLLKNRLASEIISQIDVLVDGKFIESKKVLGKFYGSSNQRIIKIKPQKSGLAF